jgi:ferredoxin
MENTEKKIVKIVVDKAKCIGSATCVVIAPEAFDLDTDGKSIAKPGAENQPDELLLRAAQSCPTRAIMLFDKDGNQVYP